MKSTDQPETSRHEVLLSTEELIDRALRETDEVARWKLICSLHRRATQGVFEAVRSLCESSNPVQKTLGADVLGQLGAPDLPFREQSITILLKIVDEENDPVALQAAVMALGRMEDARALQRLLALKNHPDEDIRFAVVHGLLGIEGQDTISALIELSNDVDEDVRNWATFGIGSLIELDSSEIREALRNRLNEADSEIRGEALVGLARRGDRAVVDPLLKEEWWDVDIELLQEAIDRCERKDLDTR
jgi:HEAT repeat protein